MIALVAEYAANLRCSLLRWNMLPNAQNHPALLCQTGAHRSIALSVASQLWPPVARVHSWLGAVLRAAVPKASVDENRKAAAGKDNVGTNRQIVGTHNEANAETQAQTV